MKKLMWILAFAIIGYFLYTHFITPLSEEAKEVKQLEKRFNKASENYVRAVRTTGEIATVALPSAEDAIRDIKKVKTELDELKKRLKEENAVERADRLEAKIKEFHRKNDLE